MGVVTTRPQRRMLLAATAVATAVVVSTVVGMTPPVVAEGAPGGLAIPGAAQAGPPDWVRPGTRVTLHGSAASIVNATSTYVEDPAGPWVDPATGTHYRRVDQTGDVTSGGAGDGISQLDVLAVDGTDVIVSQSLYAIDRTNGVFIPSGVTGGRLPGATAMGAWVTPQLLANLAPADMGGLLVLRGDFPLDGTSYHAISFVTPTPGAYSSDTYDTQTGVLLAEDTQSPSAPGGSTVGEYLTQTHFVSTRQRSLPGMGAANPAWVAGNQGLSYSGSEEVSNPLAPGTGTLTIPMRVSVKFGTTGPDWATYTQDVELDYQGMAPQHSQTSAATGPNGLYWWDPPTLAGLRTGQVLDEDPVTGERITVGSVGNGPAGPALTITSHMPGIDTGATYDLGTGVLLAYQASIPASGTTWAVQLEALP